ncbi:prolipoprotein diacylglyceryl transferase [Lactococcus termiticola]|uniref:Phosphatidylglycerol--prolipoprotein diacylglyceryl transferase n=1 Tax=Lactococcus termiticola TaxID=2169526 RepID=A0A2R5HIL4_9LACT|nr:prolipoprotein diacylglyceryl transferase [Lactococcus termiticola]GBG96188.1 diacylglyceryl transferase [Lactococcus termiticola]
MQEISLPSLALSKIALQLGPFAIHWYAIFITLGGAIAFWLALREGARKKISSDDVTDLMIWSVPFALVGARAYYVIFQWGYYSQHPDQIIALWDGGGAIYGSLIAIAIVIFVFCYYRVLRPLDMMDIYIPGIMLAQAMGRWGNFVNQEAYGRAVSNLNWLPRWMQKQMYIDGAYRLPTFLFESIGNLIGFALIMLFRHRLHLKRGEVFFFYLIWYGSLRFIVEGMRTDSLMIGPLRVSQMLSAVLVLVGLVLIIVRRKRKTLKV